ncbi:hypothetical protein DSO57_1016461, partial [Entomophthora muscae]
VYHFQVNKHHLLLIGNVFLIWVYIPHLYDYDKLSLYFTLADSPKTHLMYYNALKPHIMRHGNLNQVTNLQSLYRKAEKAEQTSNTLHKAQSEKRERPKVSHPQDISAALHMENAIKTTTNLRHLMPITTGIIVRARNNPE